MQFDILDNGNLKFTLDDGDLEDLQEEKDVQGYVPFDWAFSELGGTSSVGGTSSLWMLRPEDIGALTDAPIIGDEVDHDPGGVIGRVGRAWWFPDYQILDPVEALMDKGEVTFQAAP